MELISPALLSCVFLQIAKKGENWKIGFLKNTENRDPGFYICLTLYIALKIQTKKIQKKWRAGRLLGSAVKWAEMAAEHENGQNSKKNFSPAHGHYVASWLPTSKLLSDQPYSGTFAFFETAEKSLFQL